MRSDQVAQGLMQSWKPPRMEKECTVSLGNHFHWFELQKLQQKWKPDHMLISNMSCNEPLYVHNYKREFGTLLAHFPVYFHKIKRKKGEADWRKKGWIYILSKIDLILYSNKSTVHQNSAPYFVFGFDLGQHWEKYGVWTAQIQRTFYINL